MGNSIKKEVQVILEVRRENPEGTSGVQVKRRESAALT